MKQTGLRGKVTKRDSKLSQGAFFGTYGSPIQTQNVGNKKGKTFRAPTQKSVSSTDESSSDEMQVSTVKLGEKKCKATRRHSLEDRAKATTKWQQSTVVHRRRGSQIQLDVARKAKIPLFLDHRFSLTEDDNTQSVKVLPARQILNKRINFNEITLGKTIGEGGFGKVYEGKWRGRGVAVKMLLCQDLSDEILEEFESEVEIMSKLRHPNICRLLGACTEAGNRSLVVELASRGSLWRVLRDDKKKINNDMRLKFIMDIARGMNHLHNFESVPVLHRDLKSPNLLVDDDYTIKISDFGLARVKAKTYTMTGNCGTVQWMAPEVLANKKYTEKADVYSFGIVIWEIVTAECPYGDMSQIQVALNVLNHNARPTIPRSCPALFANLMRACWAVQPERRPSFAEIVHALREYSNRVRTASEVKTSSNMTARV